MNINYQLGCEFLIPDLSEHDFFNPEEFSVEHKMIRDAAKEFLNKEIIPNIDLLENKNTDFIRKLNNICGELGFLSTDIPEQYEGLGLDKISTALVSEVMGAVGSFGAVYSAQTGIGSLPIVFFGNDKQKKKYLPNLASGKWFAAYCLTEPGAGSDAMNITTRAALSKDGKYYILNGEKMFTTNAGWANIFVVYAKTENNEFSAFIVESTFAGITTGEEEKKMGIRGSSTRSVNFQDVKVPVENILYQVGKGHKIAFNILNICRWKLGAVTLGGCKSSISEAIKYARSRFQFNAPLSSFGVIQSKIASMAIKIYMLESLVYRIAGMIDTRLETLSNPENNAFFANSEALEEYAVECSIAKIFGSESLDYCVDEYVQILGGYGFVEEFSAQRFYRDSRINRIWLGTNEINRLLIARNYLKRIFKNKIDMLTKDRSIPNEFDFFKPHKNIKADSPLAQQKQLILFCKKIVSILSTICIEHFGEAVFKEQEILYRLSDIIIETFAMESGLLRAEKQLTAGGEKKARNHVLVVQTYVDEAISRIVYWTNQILKYALKADNSSLKLSYIYKMVDFVPVDSIRLQKEVAERAIESQSYPF